MTEEQTDGFIIDRSEYEYMKKQIEIAVKALQFYADPEHFVAKGREAAAWNANGTLAGTANAGGYAKQALEQIAPGDNKGDA